MSRRHHKHRSPAEGSEHDGAAAGAKRTTAEGPFPCPWCDASTTPGANADPACAGCGRPLRACGEFAFRGVLGKGGMGTVYRGERASDGAEVAIKVIAPPSEGAGGDWTAWELFEKSSVVLQQLHHASLPRVFGFEKTDGGRLVLVREPFDGGTLEERIRGLDSRLPPARLRTLLEELLRLLVYLQGLVPPVIHRDIKPSNVMFRTRDDWRPVLVDFDTIVSRRSGLTIVGTPGYAAPEQFAAEASTSSDVYGLGATMLFVATHRDADDLPRADGRFAVDGLLSELDERVRRVLVRMVEPEVAKRYATAHEVLEDLGSHADPKTAPHASTSAKATAGAEAPKRRRGKGWWIAAIVAGATATYVVRSNHARHATSPTATLPAVPEAEQACLGGNASSCFDIGLSYDNGTDGVKADAVHAAMLYDKGCTLGSASSCNNLGVDYEHGTGVAADASRAGKLYDAACTGKSQKGCVNGASLYLAGKGIAKDDAKAFGFRKAACTLGKAESCDDVGLMFEHGQGVPKDLGQAQTYYGISCDQGYLWGCRNLGMTYKVGIGASPDPLRAASLFKRVCDGDELEGCYQLGFLALDGKGTDKDAARAAALFGKACDGKIANACNQLGLLYDDGRGVAKDQPRASRLYQQACDGDDPYGCANAGSDYEDGTGIARDMQRAARVDRKACDGKVGRACRRLGGMYERGDGVGRDLGQAVTFYLQGCDAEDDNQSCTLARALYGNTEARVAAGATLRTLCAGGSSWACADAKKAGL